MEHKELAERIFCFIKKYAGICPDWTEEDGEDGKYTSPDAYEMISCAELISQGKIPYKCFSEWGSGGYKPYTSKEGKIEHDYLLSEIYKIIKSK